MICILPPILKITRLIYYHIVRKNFYTALVYAK